MVSYSRQQRLKILILSLADETKNRKSLLYHTTILTSFVRPTLNKALFYFMSPINLILSYALDVLRSVYCDVFCVPLYLYLGLLRLIYFIATFVTVKSHNKKPLYVLVPERGRTYMCVKGLM